MVNSNLANILTKLEELAGSLTNSRSTITECVKTFYSRLGIINFSFRTARQKAEPARHEAARENKKPRGEIRNRAGNKVL